MDAPSSQAHAQSTPKHSIIRIRIRIRIRIIRVSVRMMMMMMMMMMMLTNRPSLAKIYRSIVRSSSPPKIPLGESED
jgi:hypothetical protein